MPIYEFECTKCGRVFEELFQRAGQKRAARCPGCGSGRTRKLLSRFSARTGAGPDGTSSANCGSCARSSCAGCNEGG